MTAILPLAALIVVIVLAYIVAQAAWNRPQPPTLVIQMPAQDPGDGCLTGLAMLVLIGLVSIIIVLLLPELGISGPVLALP